MKLIKKLSLVIVSTACLSPAIGHAQETMACVKTDGVQIAALFDRWNTALKSGDARQLADLYSAEAVLLPTLSDQPRTTDAARVDYFNTLLKKQPQANIDTRTLYTGCNMAIDTGLYTFKFANTSSVQARYTFTYAWLDDQWLITSHHSSLMPEAGER
ncbi:MAG TPA: SgcJ/EcaC family oxidoreductase [Pseudomonas sp.]|jgi:uncharacterized protein (TIGR02246 family)